MQIDFASSGGVTNSELAYRADTNTMPEEQARELERLVETSGVFDLDEKDAPPNPKAGAGPPDVIAYRLSLSDGTRQRTLWFNDVTAPASIHPLVVELRRLAMDRRRKPE